ncbi:MAG: hypothetical protein RJB09_1058 [Pseudomonadota bacterium]|jgi:hypothetical protein
MIFRVAALVLLLTAPALAQEAAPVDCGSCTALDRVTMADPVLPLPLPTPPQKYVADKGKAFELVVPGTQNTITVYHMPGVGMWVSSLAPGGIFVRPKSNQLAVEMKF